MNERGGDDMAVVESQGEFDVTMPLAKVWEDDAGELCFEGVASSTSLDRQQERMTPRAIEKMASQTNLDLLPSHKAGPLEELGRVEEAWVDNESFRVAGRLDRANPQSQRLFDRVRSGRRYGLSVGGRVTKAFWQYDDEAGQQVRYIDDVELDHVAVCRPEAAANPDTYLEALAKAAEGVMNEAPDETAAFVRAGRAAIEAARSVWPFAKSEKPEETEEEDERLSAYREEMHELWKEIEEALMDMRDELKELQKAEAADEEVAEASEEGRSQALAGQERRQIGGPWANVV